MHRALGRWRLQSLPTVTQALMHLVRMLMEVRLCKARDGVCVWELLCLPLSLAVALLNTQAPFQWQHSQEGQISKVVPQTTFQPDNPTVLWPGNLCPELMLNSNTKGDGVKVGGWGFGRMRA